MDPNPEAIMRDGYTTIDTFTSSFEAEMAAKLLQSAGIEAIVHSDNAGGLEPQLDLTGGVRVLVPENEAHTAKAVLADVREIDRSHPWTCPGCGEAIEAGFDVCWKCGTAMPES
jgi:hypothetical protein